METKQNIEKQLNYTNMLITVVDRIKDESDKHKLLSRLNSFMDFLEESYDDYDYIAERYEEQLVFLYNHKDVNSLVKNG